MHKKLCVLQWLCPLLIFVIASVRESSDGWSEDSQGITACMHVVCVQDPCPLYSIPAAMRYSYRRSIWDTQCSLYCTRTVSHPLIAWYIFFCVWYFRVEGGELFDRVASGKFSERITKNKVSFIRCLDGSSLSIAALPNWGTFSKSKWSFIRPLVACMLIWDIRHHLFYQHDWLHMSLTEGDPSIMFYKVYLQLLLLFLLWANQAYDSYYRDLRACFVFWRSITTQWPRRPGGGRKIWREKQVAIQDLHPRMFQGNTCCYSFLRIHSQKLLDKIFSWWIKKEIGR